MKPNPVHHPMHASQFFWLHLSLVLAAHLHAAPIPFDAAPFALPLSDGPGLMWEDPREIHQVVVHFKDSAPSLDTIQLEYWGSWWPERHLPKDREPGGGDIGWLELGNWWKYGWRIADTEAKTAGQTITFAFRPINTKEFPKVNDYPAPFRYTLKIRLTSSSPLPAITKIQAFTDSQLEERNVRLAWKKAPLRSPQIEGFNSGEIAWADPQSPGQLLRVQTVINPDPNTFDRTLVSVRQKNETFTFKVDDLAQGPLFIPAFGVAILPANDRRRYAQIESDQKTKGAKTLYDRVFELPEQSWSAAWNGLPPKKSHICYPLGLDGGRQRFKLNADGSVEFRSNDHYLQGLPGRDTPRLALENAPVRLNFDLPAQPIHRTLVEEVLPICVSTWDLHGIRITQTAFVTPIAGAQADSAPPPADAFTILMLRFALTNATEKTQSITLPLQYGAGDKPSSLTLDEHGFLWSKARLRGQIIASSAGVTNETNPRWQWTLAPGQSQSLTLKLPYCVLSEKAERTALTELDFDREREATAGYWRRRINESAQLITPEPMLNEFYRSHAMHLLVNCEREPNSDRRFARVGSFSYGAYGNESCMMVVDLDRRGYHQEAQNCLDAWLHYQGTAGLPGSFASKAGVLYGAGGYEAGGYNQHHGWILWMLAEHYRFSRNEKWLRQAAPGILQACDWIIRETARTQDRHELERGLLPAGSLEDIGDWWTWLSTSCYTWRGLDSAAWALAQIHHPDAARIQQAAKNYHAALLGNFRTASQRSPVVRLRDGTAVPKIPSQVHRRGRSFGWICETLEGAMHLLITGALSPQAPEAEWILKDYEDNLYLSNQYGYTLDDFNQFWFSRGGMSMQACLLLDVEPYLYRDNVKHALRALFNGLAVSYFPDVRMNTEHALPEMGDWRGDHFKSSDESNAAGWLRYLFVREENDQSLLLGQGVPREWLKPNRSCGIKNTATWFGPVSLRYSGEANSITAQLQGPQRNPPKEIRLRFRDPDSRPIKSVTVNGKTWRLFQGDWVQLPGNIGNATLVARYSRK